MVAIVSGNSLGLNLTSAGVLGGAGVAGQAGAGAGGDQVYVNASTGNLVIQQLQNSLVGRGLDADSVLTYNSLGQLGTNNFSFGVVPAQLVVNANGSVTRKQFDGSQQLFTLNAGSTKAWTSTDGGGAFDTLKLSTTTNQYTWTDGSGVTEIYDASSLRLLSRTDLNGNALSFGYTSGGLLQSVTDANNEVVTYGYTGAQLTSISTSVTTLVNGVATTTVVPVVSYTYDAGRLGTVSVDLTPTAPASPPHPVFTTTYGYVGTSDQLASIKQTDGTNLSFMYYTLADVNNVSSDPRIGRVKSVLDGIGNLTAFSYDTAGKTTSVTANGQTTAYAYDGNGQLTSITAPAVNGVSAVTKFTYDASGNVASTVDGEGHTVTNTYDDRGNQVRQMDAVGDVVIRTFDGNNQLVTETTSTLDTPAMTANGTAANVSINASTISKAAGVNGTYDSSAISVEGLTGGAAVSFTAGQTTGAFAVGLTTDPTASAGKDTIDWAMYCGSAASGPGELYASENGALVDLLTTYTASDVLGVRYDGDVVSYLKNGQVLRAVAAFANSPLYLASSIATNGASVNNVRFGEVVSTDGAAVNELAQPVVVNFTPGSPNMAVDGDAVAKTATTTAWDASVQSTIGYTGGATVAYTVTTPGKAMMIGLNSDPSTDATYTGLDFGFSQLAGTGNAWQLRVNGVTVVTPSDSSHVLAVGDRVGISYDGAKTVTWTINGHVVGTYTVATPITSALYLDSSFYTPGAGASRLRLGGNGAVDPVGVLPAPVMANAGGITVSGGALTKTSGASGMWDASARSALSMSGGAEVSFTAPSANAELMVGLNSDPDAEVGSSSLDAAIHLKVGGVLEAIINGQPAGVDLGNFAAGDRLGVRYDGTRVVWLRNGQTIGSVAMSITQPLFVDTSFATLNGAITGLLFDGGNARAGSAPLPVPNFKLGSAMSLTGSALKATSADATASSLSGVVGGAAVGFSPPTTTGAMVIGLDGNPTVNVSQGSMAYAMVLDAGGSLHAMVGNTTLGAAGTYSANDRLGVRYDGNAVTWLQNGQVVWSYVPSAPVTQALYLDALIRTPGAKANNVRFGSSDLVDAFSDDPAPPLGQGTPANATILGDTITKTRGLDATWDASVQSKYALGSGATVSFIVQNVGERVAVGLNDTLNPSNNGYTKLAYAFYMNVGGALYAIVKGVPVTIGQSYAAGDRLTVTYNGAQVQFIRNGQLLYAVAVQTTAPFYLDSGFCDIGASVTGLTFSGAPSTDRTERYVRDASGNLLWQISPEGRVTKYLRDAYGNVTSTVAYTQATYETAGLGTSTAPTASDLTKWAAMQDLTQTQVDDVVRDARGQAQSSTTYTQTTSAGKGGGAVSATTFVYDASGRLLQAITPSGLTTTSTYDGLGRVTLAKDALGRLLTTSYADATSQVIVSYADGRIVTQTYDAAGRVTSVSPMVAKVDVDGMPVLDANGHPVFVTLKATAYTYDKLGHLLRETDASGISTWYLYDADGRRVGSVDGNLILTEYDYNRSDLVTRTIVHATPVSAAALVDTNGKPCNPALSVLTSYASTDRASWNVYDGANRLVQTIDPLGAVVQYVYDSLGNVVTERAYALRVGTSGLGVSPGLVKPAADAGDRITRNFYDGDGLRVGSVDPDGYLTTYQYDGAGRRVVTMRCANAVQGAAIASSLAGLLPAPSVDDQRSVTLYNAEGWMVGQVDAGGYLTQNFYDNEGRIKTSTRYATPVGTNVDPSWSVGAIQPLQDGEDHTVSYVYDPASGRLSSRTDASGALTRYTYGNPNTDQVTQLDQGAESTSSTSSTQTRYDSQGFVVETLSGVGSAVLAAISNPSVQQIKDIWAQYGVHYAVDLVGRRTSMTDADGNRTLYYYDGDGQLRFTVDAKGAVEERRYDAFGQLTSTNDYQTFIDPNSIPTDGTATASLVTWAASAVVGTKSSTTYRLDGLVSTIVDGFGTTLTTNTAYDAFGDVTGRNTLAEIGFRSDTFTYDHRGHLVSTTQDTVAGGLGLTSSSSFDAFGRVSQEVDPANRVVTMRYDRLDNLIQRSDPLAPASTWLYDAFGRLTSASSAGSTPDTTKYNTALGTAATTSAGGVVVTTTRDDFGRVTKFVDGNGNATTNTYDADGHLTQTSVKAAGSSTSTITFVGRYDDEGNLIASQDGHSYLKSTWTHYTYDKANQLEYTVDPAGGVSYDEYDALGHVVRSTTYATAISAASLASLDTKVASGIVPTTTQITAMVTSKPGADVVDARVYDANGQLIWEVDGQGDVTQISYANNGARKSVFRYWQPVATSWLSTWDLASAPPVVAQASFDAVSRWIYDALGRVVLAVDPAGNATAYQYDADGRVTQTTQYASTIPSGGQLMLNANGSAVLALGAFGPGETVTATVMFFGLTGTTTSLTLSDGAQLSVRVPPQPSQGLAGNGAFQRATITLTVPTDGSHTLSLTLNGCAAGAVSFDNVRVSGSSRGVVVDDAFDGLNAGTGVGQWTQTNGVLTARTTWVGGETSILALANSMADPARDRVSRQVYDADGRCTLSVDASGAATVYTYDTEGRVLTERRVAQAVSFGDLGDDAPTLQALVTSLQDDVQDLVSRRVYDTDGRCVMTMDAGGSVTQFGYDANGNVTSVARRYVPVSRNAVLNARDADLIVSANTHADTIHDRVTTTQYDAWNRVSVVWDPTGAVTQTLYDAGGLRTSVRRFLKTAAAGTIPAQNGGDLVSQWAYDGAGREIYRSDAAGNVAGTIYDGADHVVMETRYGTPVLAGTPDQVVASPGVDGVTRHVYDAAGRLVYDIELINRVVPGSGPAQMMSALVQYGYDGLGNATSRTTYARAIDTAGLANVLAVSDVTPVTSADDRNTRTFYDADGRVRLSVDALGFATETRYAFDHTTTVRYAVAPTISATASTTTALNNCLAIDGASDETSSAWFDAAGRQVTSIDAMGVVTRDEYDALGRVVNHYEAWGPPEVSRTYYLYDTAGRLQLTTVAPGSDGAASTSLTYDTFGEVVSEVAPGGHALAYEDTSWAQNERNRLKYPVASNQLTDAQRTTLLARFTATYVYDLDGRTKTTTNALGATTTTTYDVFGNAVKVKDPREKFGYFYFDKAGRVIKQVDPAGYVTETTYAAALGDKVASVRRHFITPASLTGIDENNPPTVANNASDALTSYTYDRLGRVLTMQDGAGTEKTVYSGTDGNLFNKQVTNKNNGTTIYVYDKRGQELNETLPVSVGGQAVVNSYTYDAFGNRRTMTEGVGLAVTSDWPGPRVTTFQYDANNRVVYRIGMSATAYDSTGVQKTVTPVDWTRYDGHGRVIETMKNAQWNGTSGTASNGECSFTYYDAAGHVVGTVAPDGSLTRQWWSADGKVWKSIAFSTRLSVGTLVAGGAAPSVSASNPASLGIDQDRTTYTYFDQLDRAVETDMDGVVWWEGDPNSDSIALGLTGTQPGLVALAKTVYDAAGNAVQQIDGRGHSTFNYFDAIGRKVLSIDADGYATAWDYGYEFDTASTQTQYAASLKASQYGRQDDKTISIMLSDPGNVRGTLEGLAVPATSPNRVTTYQLDAAGRVTEKRVKNVALTFVKSDGSLLQGVLEKTDAVTKYVYDGLGDVTREQDLIWQTLDANDVVINSGYATTDRTYDALGRLTREQSPGYTDYAGVSVRPTTDTEYDGLGNVHRVIRRGTNSAVETDDAITRYAYDVNGNKTKQFDAGGNATNFDLDLRGNVWRVTTVSGLVDTSDHLVDIVVQYTYDAMRRVTVRKDTAHADAPTNTAYNAFGQVSAQGLGANAFQEFTHYNVLGKVQCSNTGDGVSKLYLYDRDGNTSQQITSTSTDLSTISVVTAATDAGKKYYHGFSFYDARNHLIRSVEPDVKFTQDTVTMQQMYSQQLTALSGQIGTLDPNSGNWDYSQGSVDSGSYLYTTVSSDGSTAIKFQQPVAPSEVAQSSGIDAPGGNAIGLNTFGYVSGGFTGVTIGRYPGGDEYRGSMGGLTNAPGPIIGYQVLGTSSLAWPTGWTVRVGGTVAQPGQNVQCASTEGGAHLAIELGIPGYAGYVNVGSITNDYIGNPGEWSRDYSVSISPHIFLQGLGSATNVSAYLNYGTGSQSSVPVTKYGSNGVYGIAQSSGTVTVVATDANGIVSFQSLNVSSSSIATMAAGGTAIAPQDAWIGDKGTVHFAKSVLSTGTSTPVYYRLQNATGAWTPATVSGSTWTLPAFTAGKTYDFYVAGPKGDSAGNILLDASGAVTLGNSGSTHGAYTMLAAPQVYKPAMQFSMGGSLASSNGTPSSYQMVLSVDGGAASAPITLVSGSATLDIDTLLGKTLARFGAAASHSYTYTVYANMPASGASTAGKQIVGQGTGSFTVGNDDVLGTSTGTTMVRPVGLLKLNAGTVPSGTITLASTDGRVVTINDLTHDWRVVIGHDADGTATLNIDMSELVDAAGTQTVTMSYTGSDASFTGTYTVQSNGTVTCTKVSSQVRQPYVPIVVPGATKMTVFKYGAPLADQSTMTSDLGNVTTAGSTFTWDASAQAGKGQKRFYYEATDASNKVVGKGYGTMTLAADGTLNCSMDPALLKPSILQFTIPASAASRSNHVTLSVQFRSKVAGSNWTTTTYANQVPGTAINVSVPGTGAFDCIYTYTDSTTGWRVNSGSGPVTVAANGGVTSSFSPDRLPVILTGPINEPVAQMELDIAAVAADDDNSPTYTPIFLTGVWSDEQQCTLFSWDANAYMPTDGTTRAYLYQMHMQNAPTTANTAGTPWLNLLGDPVDLAGVMTLGTGSSGVDLKQYITSMDATAQVRHYQTWNAFGEIAQEYDDTTLQHANDVADLYDETITDPTAVRTDFVYNALGKLISKSDPETSITLANGYRYRGRPVTTYTYDLLGRLATSTDANNNTSKQTFLAGDDQHVWKRWAADAGLRRMEYDVFGQSRIAVDELGNVTNSVYDLMGNLTRSTQVGVKHVNASGVSVTVQSLRGTTYTDGVIDDYTYDALGHRITHVNALGVTDKTYYDSLGRVIQSITGIDATTAGRTTKYGYVFTAAGTGGANGARGEFARWSGTGASNFGGWTKTTIAADLRTQVDAVDYFGLTISHTDEAGDRAGNTNPNLLTHYQAGTKYVYTYDVGGHLVSQVGTDSNGNLTQNIQYQYCQNGDIKQSIDLSGFKVVDGEAIGGTMVRYGYDNSGNRTYEQYSGLDTTGSAPGNVIQSSQIYYDELNRMIRVVDPAEEDIRYEYDAVGNRREVDAYYWDPLSGGLRDHDTFWYTYDATNRFTLTKGSLDQRGTSATDARWSINRGGTVSGQGVQITYDQRGDRMTALNADDSLEKYTYSQDGFLMETRIQAPGAGAAVMEARRVIDGLGRTTDYIQYAGDGTTTLDGTITVDTKSIYDNDARLKTTVDKDGNAVDYYYYGQYVAGQTDSLASATQAGNGALAKVVTRPKTGSGTETDYTYVYFDSAKQIAAKIVSSGNSAWAAGYSNLAYDVNGFISQAWMSDGTGRTYMNSANGLVIERTDMVKVDGVSREYQNFWYYAADHMVGDVSTDPNANQTRTSYAEQQAQTTPGGKTDNSRFKTNGPTTSSSAPVTSSDFDQNYQPINASYPAGTGSAYTVRDGDTLKAIAQAIWGDSAMWYLIADTNNLSGSETLVAGQILQIPNKVANIHNNANTFKPYNPGEVIGHIDPSLPAPPAAPAAGGCGTVGIILMAIVATVFTAGAAAAVLAPTFGSTIMGLGAAVLTGTAGFSAGVGMAIAAVAGAVGSVAAQAVGNMTGNQKGFSWKQVATSAVGSGLTAGVGSGMSSMAGSVAETTGSETAGQVFSGASNNAWVQGAHGVALATAAAATTDLLKGEWSWRGVGAAAVGSAAGSAAGAAAGEALEVAGPDASAFANRLGSSMGGAWSQHEVMATDPRYSQANTEAMFADSLGQAIGGTVKAGSSSGGGQSDSSPAADPAEFAQMDFVPPDVAGAAGGGVDFKATRSSGPQVQDINWAADYHSNMAFCVAQPGEGALALGACANPSDPFAGMAYYAATGQISYDAKTNTWPLTEGRMYTSDMSEMSPDQAARASQAARADVSAESAIRLRRALAATVTQQTAVSSGPGDTASCYPLVYDPASVLQQWSDLPVSDQLRDKAVVDYRASLANSRDRIEPVPEPGTLEHEVGKIITTSVVSIVGGTGRMVGEVGAHAFLGTTDALNGDYESAAYHALDAGIDIALVAAPGVLAAMRGEAAGLSSDLYAAMRDVPTPGNLALRSAGNTAAGDLQGVWRLDDSWSFGRCNGDNCFVAGTLVHTREGLKHIEDIRAGDIVASRHPASMETGWQRVEATFRWDNKPLLDVQVRTAQGAVERIKVTPEHPFYVAGAGWLPAREMRPGDTVSLHDVATAEVFAVTDNEEKADVYNFSVSEFHTYFVGTLGVWVHNASTIYVNGVGNTEMAGAPALGATGPVAPKMSIGASGYSSYDELAHATYTTYQAAVDEGYAAAQEALQNGSLRVPPGSSQQMVLGQETDAFARDTMKLWAQGEGLPEGAGAPNIIQINRRLLDPSFSGAYRIPDVFVPPAGQIFDASLEFKTWDLPQIQDFWNYSNGSRITIVRPTEVGGSYSLLPPW